MPGAHPGNWAPPPGGLGAAAGERLAGPLPTKWGLRSGPLGRRRTRSYPVTLPAPRTSGRIQTHNTVTQQPCSYRGCALPPARSLQPRCPEWASSCALRGALTTTPHVMSRVRSGSTALSPEPDGQVQVSALLSSSCGLLGQLFDLSVPRSPYCERGRGAIESIHRTVGSIH